MSKGFLKNISRLFLIGSILFSITGCEDSGCISADDFGGVYVEVESNPDSVYGRYPLQSTDWKETGLRASGSSIRLAITGAWVPWGMVASNEGSLNRLQSCLGTRNIPIGNVSNNYGLCAKKVPINTSVTPNALKVGAARINDLNQQNCICYKNENPIGIPDSTNAALTTPSPSCSTAKTFDQAALDPNTSDSCSCQKISDINSKPATEDYCVFHFTLSDKEKTFDSVTENPTNRESDYQGNICKMTKGMGLYMGLFGRNGNRQPLRAYHLFTQTEECPVTRDSQGRCLQESGENDANGNPIMIDRTRYIYETSGMPIYDDKSGNDCTDTDPSDDERHRMREVVKLKIQDSYFQDNYGSYRVEFLSGVYSDDEAQIMEAIVNLIEEVLIGRLDITTGQREGGLLNFLYNSIIGNYEFILVVKLCLVFYIVSFGVTTLMGLVEINRKEMFTRILQIGFVLLFTTEGGWEMYDNYVVKFFKEGMDEVVNRFSLYANSFFLEGETTTNPMRAAQLRSANPDSMGSKFAYIDFIIRMLFSEAITKKIWSLFFYDIFGLIYIIVIYMLIFYFLQSMGIVVFVYCVTITKMVMALALGPIFFVFMLFKQTNDYFKKWITFLAARSLEMVILFLLVFIFIAMIDRRFNELLYYSACIWELDLWLFKLKFLVARDVFIVDANGNPTTNGRDLIDWFIMFARLGLIIYATKQVIMQVPQLAGKLISIGGSANQTGTGTSYAASAFNIGAGMASEVFGAAKSAGSKAVSKAGGLAFRGSRELLKNTAPLRALGYGLDKIGRAAIRNSIIDDNINKAMKLADAKGLSGSDKDKYVRNYVANSAYSTDKAGKGQGGIRDWSSKNPNSAGLLNINSDTIAARLDKKLLEEPMKKAMKDKAEELKKMPADKMPLGQDMKAALEQEALKWAGQNSSQDPSLIGDVMGKIKGQRVTTMERSTWRPRRVNFLDELSKVGYEGAAKGSMFGGNDESKERYLSYLKSRQFEKAKKSGKQDLKYGDVAKGSKGFVRRAHDMKEWGNVGLKNLKNLQNIDKLSPLRSRRDKELKDLEYNAIRKSLMGNEFSNEKNRLAQRYDDQNSLERQRAKFYGEDYGRLLDKKRDKALEEVDEKRKFFMDSLDSKMQGSAKSHFEKLSFDEQEKFKKDLMNTRNEIAARYRQDMLGDKIGSLDKKNIADGLVDARLDNPLKVGDKDYNNLSLFELESMMKSLGMASIGDSAKLLQEMKDRAQKEYDKAKSKEGDGLTDSQKAIQDKQEKEAALEGEAKKFQEELQRNFDKLSAEEKDRMRSAHDEAERAISGYRSSVTSLNGDINAMARARGELQAMLGDPNLSSAQYNEIAAMINSINNEVIREKLLADYQNTKDKIDSGDFNNKELIGVLAGRIGEQVNDANYQLDQARNAAFGAIDGAHELADVSKLQESIAEFSNANSAYNKDFDKMVKEEVIVKDLKVEFGQSLADAFSIGAQDALIKGGDVSIGGQQAEVMVDGIAVANAQMTYAQHKFAVKSNKNKMAHLEYQKSSLERELNEAKRNGDDRAVNDLSHQIGSIDSDLSSVKRDNAMELSRMNEAETAISRLQGSNV